MAPRTSSSKGPKAKTATSHARAPQQVRIIGGQYKRTPLPVVDADGLRPTSDRVRETVFNWLGQDLTGWRCADLFAGTGALGFEAASRGAAHGTLIENHAPAVRALHAIRDRLDARMVDIVSGDAFAWLARQPDAAFDAVFIDPPFAHDWTLRALEAATRVVKPGGVIYVEAAQPLVDVSANSHDAEPMAGTELPTGLTLHKHLRAGAVHAHLLLRKNG
jgi:16S rRNA (guanine966-N2)-methyltransferase